MAQELHEVEKYAQAYLNSKKDCAPSDFDIAQKFYLSRTHPFTITIDLIKQVEKTTNPMQKFQIIGQIRDQIMKEVAQYYNEEQLQSSSEELVFPEIMKEDFLNILSYCMFKSEKPIWVRTLKFTKFFLQGDIYSEFEAKSLHFMNFNYVAREMIEKGKALLAESSSN
eukprot:TRINITY_DN9212_c0_g1_i1.p1 TRINITY_DN9212_c0_g1~~TRINITY_DN9212_c0_g1_i1.p1  ORF type:complete len:168 (+),score=32.57 TRINITY_DN9212_c0_g1_i1:753-1256(+)